MSEFKNLTLEVADGIAVLAISRPAALNALNSETLDELNVCLCEIEATDEHASGYYRCSKWICIRRRMRDLYGM